MNIFDFRLRPPYRSFTRLGIYSPVCNETAPQKHHGIPSRAARSSARAVYRAWGTVISTSPLRPASGRAWP